MLRLVTEAEKQEAELVFYPKQTVMEVWQLNNLINNLHPRTKIIIEGRLIILENGDIL